MFIAEFKSNNYTGPNFTNSTTWLVRPTESIIQTKSGKDSIVRLSSESRFDVVVIEHYNNSETGQFKTTATVINSTEIPSLE